MRKQKLLAGSSWKESMGEIYNPLEGVQNRKSYTSTQESTNSSAFKKLAQRQWSLLRGTTFRWAEYSRSYGAGCTMKNINVIIEGRERERASRLISRFPLRCLVAQHTHAQGFFEGDGRPTTFVHFSHDCQRVRTTHTLAVVVGIGQVFFSQSVSSSEFNRVFLVCVIF